MASNPSFKLTHFYCFVDACQTGYGVYNETVGCIECEAGFYSNETDAEPCHECPPGMWSTNGSDSCRKWNVTIESFYLLDYVPHRSEKLDFQEKENLNIFWWKMAIQCKWQKSLIKFIQFFVILAIKLDLRFSQLYLLCSIGKLW